ncbi:lactation elevated protein 1-like isoform X1 [Iris pallida]|uniref:Lactation elevated protein 1-like isoform X1 n=1 Tax=Iris pallida TaxID=29817 RepID=A0AAX6HUJ7_IRIPA|nr:lactation elevated protein 1-like isoform X1 [Iris pallida]
MFVSRLATTYCTDLIMFVSCIHTVSLSIFINSCNIGLKQGLVVPLCCVHASSSYFREGVIEAFFHRDSRLLEFCPKFIVRSMLDRKRKIAKTQYSRNVFQAYGLRFSLYYTSGTLAVGEGGLRKIRKGYVWIKVGLSLHLVCLR